MKKKNFIATRLAWDIKRDDKRMKKLKQRHFFARLSTRLQAETSRLMKKAERAKEMSSSLPRKLRYDHLLDRVYDEIQEGKKRADAKRKSSTTVSLLKRTE